MPLRDLGVWVAPWFVGALLGGVTLLGLLTASHAPTGDAYAAGLVAAALGFIALIWLVKRSIDGPVRSPSPGVFVERLDSLLLLIALLTAIGIGGLFLAAYTRGPTEIAGYALFAVCVLMVAGNVKHYYDRTASRRSGDGGALR